MIQVLEHKSIKKARKNHRCSYCNAVIRIGGSYELSKVKYGMEYYEVKAHTYCHAVAHELISSGYFLDEGIGMTTFDFERCVKQLHDRFCAPLFLSTAMTMSRDLAYVLERKRLRAHVADGYTEWLLEDREDGTYIDVWKLVERR